MCNYQLKVFPTSPLSSDVGVKKIVCCVHFFNVYMHYSMILVMSQILLKYLFGRIEQIVVIRLRAVNADWILNVYIGCVGIFSSLKHSQMV